MKKLIFSIFLFLSIAPHAFAGADTDAICADKTLSGPVYKNITVVYPANEVSVQDVRKEYIANGEPILYYVVNVLSNTKIDMYMGKYTERAELYSYNCKTQQPQLLSRYTIGAVGEWYGIDQIIQNNIVLRRYQSASDEGGSLAVSIFSTSAKKTLFTISNKNKAFYQTTVTGFVDGSGAWYLYFAQPGYGYDMDNDSALFRIDKKTKKVTKL